VRLLLWWLVPVDYSTDAEKHAGKRLRSCKHGVLAKSCHSSFPCAATVGVITETNAEKAIEELKACEADVATALRDGRWAGLPAAGE